MTISKGSPYGEPGVGLGPHGVVCADDAAARLAVLRAIGAGEPIPPLGLLGGDLRRTLGGGHEDAGGLRGGGACTFPVDLVEVVLDGTPTVAVAHVVARDRLWGDVVAIGNAAWLGRWNPWPRAHPGDAKLDLLRARVAVGERWKVRARLPLGAHHPHPGLSEVRARAHVVELERPLRVRVDGTDLGPVRRIEVSVRPDALRVTV